MSSKMKYPRTAHLPWSQDIVGDDLVLADVSAFAGHEVVVTEKMDGENTTLYRDGLHARSLDSAHHPSRSWVKALHARIAHAIPPGWRLCGENLYACHSIAYRHLPSYFLLFSLWDERNVCLSWDETCRWAARLGLATVPVLYRGVWDERRIKALYEPMIEGDACEGYVVRLAGAFSFDDFGTSVGKFVRATHVQTDHHWMRLDAPTDRGQRIAGAAVTGRPTMGRDDLCQAAHA